MTKRDKYNIEEDRYMMVNKYNTNRYKTQSSKSFQDVSSHWMIYYSDGSLKESEIRQPNQ